MLLGAGLCTMVTLVKDNLKPWPTNGRNERGRERSGSGPDYNQ